MDFTNYRLVVLWCSPSLFIMRTQTKFAVLYTRADWTASNHTLKGVRGQPHERTPSPPPAPPTPQHKTQSCIEINWAFQIEITTNVTIFRKCTSIKTHGLLCAQIFAYHVMKQSTESIQNNPARREIKNPRVDTLRLLLLASPCVLFVFFAH